MLNNKLQIKNLITEHLDSLTQVLKMGANLTIFKRSILVSPSKN